MNAEQVVAIAGATGAVGVELLKCLEQRSFPVKELRLLASARSKGKELPFRGEPVIVEELAEERFEGVDIAFFSAGGKISREFVPKAARRGALVIDNSSAFRMDPEVPLVVPEINPEAASEHKGIIANPNCSTIIAITPLWPIHRVNPIRRLIVTTYQAASGAGAAAMRELLDSTHAYLHNKEHIPTVLPHPYAFNLFSHNSAINSENGYNEEEIKVIKETWKIFGDPTMRISATCVRVPVLRAHSEALVFECEHPIAPEKVRALLEHAPGVRIVDRVPENYFPMPRDASGQDDILVGRIRKDLSDPSGRSITLFVCGDQLLKGAALNAVQIAELMVARGREPVPASRK
jgi:aspartate-semialdehyde dehydrogenase